MAFLKPFPPALILRQPHLTLKQKNIYIEFSMALKGLGNTYKHPLDLLVILS